MSKPTFEAINEALGETDDMGNNSIEVLRDAARAYLHTLSGYAERDVGALLERLRTKPEPLDGVRVAKVQERLPDDLDSVAEGGLLGEAVGGAFDDPDALRAMRGLPPMAEVESRRCTVRVLSEATELLVSASRHSGLSPEEREAIARALVCAVRAEVLAEEGIDDEDAEASA